MKQYRETKLPRTQQTVPSHNNNSINTLALRVGLDDFVLGHQSQDGPQTVEQEYLSYITLPIEDHPDPLIFWEVQFVNF
jgi:hypothetical protein